MKTVTRIDSVKQQERNNSHQAHQEKLQKSIGMVKLDGQYLKELSVMVSAEDLSAFRKYRSEILNERRGHMTGMEIIYEMLCRRDELDELVISESSILTPLDVRMDTELYEELKREAQRYKVTLNDYIRAILYGLGQAADKRKHERLRTSIDSTNHNRFIQVPYFIAPEIREKLYKKHGTMSDQQLVKLAQGLITDALSK